MFERHSPPGKRRRSANSSVLIWISLCNLCVLCDSVVVETRDTTTTESQRTQRLHREEVQTKTYPANLCKTEKNSHPRPGFPLTNASCSTLCWQRRASNWPRHKRSRRARQWATCHYRLPNNASGFYT